MRRESMANMRPSCPLPRTPTVAPGRTGLVIVLSLRGTGIEKSLDTDNDGYENTRRKIGDSPLCPRVAKGAPWDRVGCPQFFADYAVWRRFHGLFSGRASFKTLAVCFSRKRRSFSRRSGRELARIAMASRAALVAPGLPMARVATGMPAGIWTMERRESMPFRDLLSMGTPRTGRVV